MNFLNSVSRLAIVCASGALLMAAPASAQTAANIAAANLISGFSLLGQTPAGQTVLNQNLATSIGINNNSTAAQRAQALSDNTVAALVGSMSNGLLVADGLGPKLYSVFATQDTVSRSYVGVGLSPSFQALLSQINSLTVGGDSAFSKNYLANGSVNGNPANQATGITLPAGGAFNVYDTAYRPLPANANLVGNSRPVQVAPNAIQTFSGTDFFGDPVNSAVGILPTLRSNASFPSGHSAFGFTSSLLLAMMVPERFQQELTRGSEYANSRIVLGAHYALDAIGARIQSIYALVQILNNNPDYLGKTVPGLLGGNITTTNDFAGLYASAQSDLRTLLIRGCGGATIAACAASDATSASDRFANAAQNKANYTYQLTYGLSPVGPTNLAPVVPVGAEVLIATRFPYLSAAQRRDVLATTEIASGQPLDDGSGYARLNLYAAADGYGAFNSQVAVTMNAALGGFNAADSWNNNISGTGGLTLGGSGLLTLTGTNTYSGPTIVNGGALMVNGSIVSPTTVNSGGAFGGTGSSGNVTVNAGGTLMPGALATPGTLTINGNLALNAGSTLALQVTPTAASQTKVNGSATIAATAAATATIAAGSYAPGTRLTVMSTAPGGLTGSFASLSFTSGGFNGNVTPRLSYDAQDVYLTFGQAALPALPAGASGNANRILTALNKAANDGAVFPTSFQALYNLTPAGAAATLNQLGSQPAAGVGQAVTRSMGSFFGSVMDFGAPGRGTAASGTALGFAPDTPVAPQFANAYAALNKAGMATKALTYVEPVRWAAWTSFFGGQDKLSGDAGAGSQDLTTRIYGGTGGLDYRLSSTTTLGGAVSGGESQFTSGGGAGDGHTDFFQAGVYARHAIGDGYIAESIAGGTHQVRTDRSASIAGALDRLGASFSAQTIAGRVEGGQRFAYGQFGLTPYAAVQIQSVFTPDYAETSALGTGLGLSYRGQTSTTTRSEIGSWIDSRVAGGSGQATLRGRVAWVHDFNPGSTVTAAFATLPGASFVIDGARRSANSALLSGAIEIPLAARVTASARVDGEFGSRATTLAGTGTLRYAW